ncbi:uncharacterized protein LOC111006852 [Momordica charantia]|uniref:Uncharacterized protein LOC111006852 n=1 Tax=Momordica charantia TaxID=3673 RepID=A0A6J1C2J0_MOMCH|nr:uncharacterized protein LOC111006852 [Momordica charantia]
MLQYSWLLPFAVIIMANAMVPLPCAEGVRRNVQMKTIIKTQTFLSPLFTLTPGSVAEKFYYHINFPKSHIAIKSFDHVEIVDESGNPQPLSEAYLHHWAAVRYYQRKDAADPDPNTSFTQLQEPDFMIAGNNGVCQKQSLPQFYGMGSESRETSTFLPHPYGIEVGDASQVPAGYEERWCLNVHVIDTRGAENKLGCMECWCDLYNVTADQFGVPLGPHYRGGLRCCYDGAQCRVSGSGYGRNLFVRYTVKWVDWDDFVVPVEVYIFDVTDTWNPFTDDSDQDPQHHCLVEYDVVANCNNNPTNKGYDECNATKRTRLMLPSGGYVIYGVAHQHIGGIGATLYGEDGRVLCSSSPIYGEGNEAGYLVGMSTCYPQPGSVKINNGEMMTVESKYDPTQNHTGVMALFHVMVAQKLPKSLLKMEALSKVPDDTNI